MKRTLFVTALVLCAAVTTAFAPIGPSGAATSSQAAAVTSTSPLRLLSAPATVTAYTYRGRAYFDAGLRVAALGEPFQLWSNRASYNQPIKTVWRRASGDVELPLGTMTGFSGLPGWIKMTYRDRAGTVVRRSSHDVCLNGSGERISPEAPARSPYPMGCPYNKFSLGSVVGIQFGWATDLEMEPVGVRLTPGRYRVTATIPRSYRQLFHIPRADGSRDFRLVVRKGTPPDQASGEGLVLDRGLRYATRPERLVPAAHEPASARAGAPVSAQPDLRSLPAFDIGVSRGGNFLQFSGTVWNAGDSPLVVDGFRRTGESVMDAYQYFFDADGNQTGYQRVGSMEWDAKDTHRHWHFRDFARYRLLRADKAQAVRSRKEAFCLANTDDVDYTVPGADWQPDGTDLQTSCGDYDSLSIREVLSAGSGDTYAQFRAGQSFDLRGLPNGRYYISVEANPTRRLVESASDNNIALRTVIIGGKPGARTVRALPVGLIH